MDIRIKDLFSGVGDPRVEKTKKHPLENVLYIVLCGTVSGVDSWIGFQDYAEEHFDIDLPHIALKILYLSLSAKQTGVTPFK